MHNGYVSCILPGAVDTNLYNLSPSKEKLAKKLGVMHNPHFIAKKGLQIMFKNKGQLVPGLLNKFSLVLLKLVPDFVIRKILESRNR
jgi:short-subunit dehydrogenase